MIDRLTGLALEGPQPWWVYALLLFIPFCVLLCIREAVCWFWKLNKLVNRLDRLETRLLALQTAITQLAADRPTPAEVKDEEYRLKDQDFSLD